MHLTLPPRYFVSFHLSCHFDQREKSHPLLILVAQINHLINLLFLLPRQKNLRHHTPSTPASTGFNGI